MKTNYFNNMMLSLGTKTLANLCMYVSPFNGGRIIPGDLGTGSGPQVITTGGAN